MPADTTRIFVALRPDEPLDALIRGHKRRLLAAAGPQMYVTDPPHTTLYLAEFAAGRVAEVLRRAGEVAGAIPMPAVATDGWHVFESDPLTGLHTLVCRFDAASCERLRLVQLRVLDAIAPLHESAPTLAALAPRLPRLTVEQQRCAQQIGFPYIGGGWIPHLTIASVRPEQWPHVGQVFNLSQPIPGQVENLSCRGHFTALEVFELHGLEPRTLATFSLASPPMGKVA